MGQRAPFRCETHTSFSHHFGIILAAHTPSRHRAYSRYIQYTILSQFPLRRYFANFQDIVAFHQGISDRARDEFGESARRCVVDSIPDRTEKRPSAYKGRHREYGGMPRAYGGRSRAYEGMAHARGRCLALTGIDLALRGGRSRVQGARSRARGGSVDFSICGVRMDSGMVRIQRGQGEIFTLHKAWCT